MRSSSKFSVISFCKQFKIFCFVALRPSSGRLLLSVRCFWAFRYVFVKRCSLGTFATFSCGLLRTQIMLSLLSTGPSVTYSCNNSRVLLLRHHEAIFVVYRVVCDCQSMCDSRLYPQADSSALDKVWTNESLCRSDLYDWTARVRLLLKAHSVQRWLHIRLNNARASSRRRRPVSPVQPSP